MPNDAQRAQQPEPSSQGAQDIYNDETKPEEKTPKTTGDYVHDIASNASQDYRDLDTVSGGQVGEAVKNKANELKDRYFPGKKKSGETAAKPNIPMKDESGATGKFNPQAPKMDESGATGKINTQAPRMDESGAWGGSLKDKAPGRSDNWGTPQAQEPITTDQLYQEHPEWFPKGEPKTYGEETNPDGSLKNPGEAGGNQPTATGENTGVKPQESPEAASNPQSPQAEGVSGSSEAPLAGGNKAAVSGPGENFSMDSLGQASNAGEKTAELTDKAAQGTKAFNEGVELGQAGAEGLGEATEAAGVVGEGVEASTGAATGGIALAVIEGAKKAYKIAKNVYNIVRKGMQIKERIEAAGRLMKKYGKWCACCALIPTLIMIGMIVIMIKIFHLDTVAKAGQAIVNLFHRKSEAGEINFTDSGASSEAVSKGDVGEAVAHVFTGLPADMKPTFNFIGKPSPVTGKNNQPYEFDLVTYNTINCIHNGSHLDPIKIELSPTFAWQSKIISGKESARCAVGSYPENASSFGSIYDALGPGEFSLSEIASAGPKARNQASAQAIEDVVQANAKFVNDKDAQDVPLKKLIISTEVYNAIASRIMQSLLKAYPDSSPGEIIEKSSSAGGIHFEFD